MNQNEKLALAARIRQGMVVDPVIPDGFGQYPGRVERTEAVVPTSVGDSRLWILREKGKTGEGALPLYVNIHGGGFVRPHMERDHLFASMVTCEAGCVTLDLDYRLAPEYPYPAAVEECFEVVRWAVAHAGELGADPGRVMVGGHSSGGNIAAAVAMKAGQTREFAIRLLLLDYPPVDLCTDPADKPHEGDTVIDPERARAYNALYVDPEAAGEPYASPLLAPPEMLAGLPQTLVITAGQDTLRFEAEQFAARLAAAGVQVTMQRFLHSKHGFMTHCREEYEKGHELYLEMMRRSSGWRASGDGA